jgi:16S rRNA (adenine1518-N6/adenine1519-N6)-dimethyltransferase
VVYTIDLPPLNVPQILKEYGLRPVKRLGQNYLISPESLRRVIEIASITSDEEVLEIGAGIGSLTRLLATHAKRVVAVEIDELLIPPLLDTLRPFQNIKVIEGDILDLDPAQLMETSKYVVVANIPYYITTAIIRHLMESDLRPHRMILTVQREVAERICAKPDNMSLLSLSVQVFGVPSIETHIRAGSFYPPPKVDSAVIRIELLPEPRIPINFLPVFFDLARAAFAQKRKKLRNSLAALPEQDTEKIEQLLTEAGIDPSRRPASLSLNEWGNLVSEYVDSNEIQRE